MAIPGNLCGCEFGQLHAGFDDGLPPLFGLRLQRGWKTLETQDFSLQVCKQKRGGPASHIDTQHQAGIRYQRECSRPPAVAGGNLALFLDQPLSLQLFNDFTGGGFVQIQRSGDIGPADFSLLGKQIQYAQSIDGSGGGGL